MVGSEKTRSGRVTVYHDWYDPVLVIYIWGDVDTCDAAEPWHGLVTMSM